MVALTRRSVALLAIAACATTALAAEGPAEENVQVVSDLPEGQKQAELSPPKGRISPAGVGGAAVGVVLLMALSYFGLGVLGAKIIQTDEKTAGNKVAEEIMLFTEKFTLSTPLYTSFVQLTYEEKASDAIKAIKDEEKAAKLETIGAQIQEFLSTLEKDGAHTVDIPIADGKCTISFDVRFMDAPSAPEASGEKPAESS